MEHKPCPFCGFKASDYEYAVYCAPDTTQRECKKCGARGPIADRDDGYTEADELWNKRA